MGRKREIILETRKFEKVGDATNFFRLMLHRYKLGQRVSDEDALDLMAILDLHSEKTEKVGCGISHFFVDVPPEFSGRCFWIFMTDGTTVDFYTKQCLDGKS